MPNKASVRYPSGYVKNLYLSGLAAQLTFGKNIKIEIEKADKQLQFPTRHGENEVQSQGARDNCALTGEAGNVSRPQVIVEAIVSSSECVNALWTQDGRDLEYSRVMQTNFRDPIAKIFPEHSDSLVKNNNLDVNKFDSKKELQNLFECLCFIFAWSDFMENYDEIDEVERKKIRQSMKFKNKIPKLTRRYIHCGLYNIVVQNLQRFWQVAEDNEEKKLIEHSLNCLKKIYHDEDIDSAIKKKSLIIVIDNFLKYKKFNYIETENLFLEAAKLISTFSFWSDKLLNGCGFGIGLIASLACGLSTGGAIFILLVGFSLPLGFVIPLSLLIFLAGTRSNFQLFSQHIPQFFQDLFKKDNNLQLSRNKKFLLLPAGFLSLSVGIAAAAITYLEGTKMIALICPALAATCPHLIVVLLGVLAAALLIGLTIVMLRTFVGVLQSQFSWQEIKQNICEKWQNLNFIKCLDYVVRVVVMAAALFGLGYLDLTGTPTLAGLLGWVAADIITLAAILGDLPFTLMTALAWYNSLFKNNSNPNSAVPKDISYYICKIVEFFALIINAFGNAALVFTNSSVSRVASIAAFMNSYASNRIQEDGSPLIRARINATKKSLSSLCTFFKSASETSPVEPLMTNGLLNGV